jgi:IclR family acetate operon transcriptional repressor
VILRRTSYSPVRKAFAVLELLAREGKPMSAPDLGAELAMTRQTIHRTLNQLEELGMVQRDVERERYEVAPALAGLGLQALGAVRAAKLRHAVLERLVMEVRETSNIGVLDGNEVVYIDRCECDWPLRVQLKPGSRLPAYCTAIGKLLLAQLSQRQLNQYLLAVPLERLTPTTLTSAHALGEALREIRAKGYSINNQEDSVGLLAIAVPIRDGTGAVRAGLSVHGPEIRLPRSRAVDLVPRLTETATAISGLLFPDD